MDQTWWDVRRQGWAAREVGGGSPSTADGPTKGPGRDGTGGGGVGGNRSRRGTGSEKGIDGKGKRSDEFEKISIDRETGEVPWWWKDTRRSVRRPIGGVDPGSGPHFEPLSFRFDKECTWDRSPGENRWCVPGSQERGTVSGATGRRTTDPWHATQQYGRERATHRTSCGRGPSPIGTEPAPLPNTIYSLLSRTVDGSIRSHRPPLPTHGFTTLDIHTDGFTTLDIHTDGFTTLEIHTDGFTTDGFTTMGEGADGAGRDVKCRHLRADWQATKAVAMADADARLAAIFEAVQREGTRKLEEALDKKSGKKALVMERSISSSLSLVANTAMLKDHGVDGLYHLDPDLRETGALCDYYFVRPGIKNMKLVAEHVKKSAKISPAKEFYVFCIPRVTLLCQKVLEEEGVYGSVLMNELELEFLLPQSDVFSLELQKAGKEIFVDGNLTSSFYLARALMNFQVQFGLIPYVLGKGKEASEVARIMSHMRKELGVAGPSTGSPQVQSMVLIDRQVDWITAMLTPLTYEGLIDDCFGIKNRTAEIPDGERGSTTQKVALNDTDKLYTELKNMNWVTVGKRLSEKTSAIKVSHEGYRGASLESQSVSELKKFVKKIQNLPEVQKHVLLADQLARATKKKSFVGRLQAEQQALEGRNLDATCEYLSDLMFSNEPLLVVLKLMCLLSVMYGGLPKKTYDGLRQDLLRTYGYQHLATLRNLQDAGLLSRQEHGKNYFSLTKKVLRLSVDEELDEDQPSDISFVYSGWYAPLSVRLVERAFSGGWRVIEDVLRLLPGAQFEIEQLVDEKGLPVERLLTSIPPGDTDTKPLVLVVFVGGVTYAEIAALRWLNTQKGMTHAFAIATTHLMSSGNVIGPMIETRKLA